MKYSPTQLEIIRIFGKKEWKDGCLFISQEDYHCGNSLYEKGEVYEQSYFRESHPEKYEILGHIPNLEDIFRVAEEKGYVNVTIDNDGIYITTTIKITSNSFWKIKYNPTLQLLDQSEDTLNQLISLFK